MTVFIIDVECAGVTSFHDTVEAVKLSGRLGATIRTKILGIEFLVQPGDDPHELYAAHRLISVGYLPNTKPITARTVRIARQRAEADGFDLATYAKANGA